MQLSLFRIYRCPVACIVMVVYIIIVLKKIHIYKNLLSAIITKFILKDVFLFLFLLRIISSSKGC